MTQVTKPLVSFEDSLGPLDIRVGRIVDVVIETRTHKPTYKMVVDFGKSDVYPIERDFRKRIGLSADAGLGALTPDQGLESGHWAENEFGGAPLGDARLSKRLVRVAEDKADAPGRAYSGVAKGDWPKVKAYYRMIDQPEESAVSMPNILAPHRERTVRRMMGQRTVLCIQDGSDLNYTNLDQCEGLGELGSNQTGAKSRGPGTIFALHVSGRSQRTAAGRFACPRHRA
jgi:hypothetical protein